MEQNQTLRLFLGIPMDSGTLRTLQEVYRTYHEGIPWKWVRPDLYHITVYFFGEVPIERLDNMVALLSLGLRGTALPPLELDQYTYAPPGQEARMLWVRYRKQEAFKQLVQRIHQLYQQIDDSIQMRKSPIPHVTLARMKAGRSLNEINLRKLPLPPAKLPISKIILWKSLLMPSGPQYEEIMDFDVEALR